MTTTQQDGKRSKGIIVTRHGRHSSRVGKTPKLKGGGPGGDGTGHVKRKRSWSFLVALVLLVACLYTMRQPRSATAKQMGMTGRAFLAWRVSLGLVAVAAVLVMVVSVCMRRSVVLTGVLSAVGSSVLFLGASVMFQMIFGEDSAFVVILMAFWVLSLLMFAIVALYSWMIKSLSEAALRRWFLQQLVIPGTIMAVGVVLRGVSAAKNVDMDALAGTVHGLLITLLVIRQMDAAVKLMADEDRS